jgi:hypothetical protein
MGEPEWGPWIEHDGTGCPCPGEYVMCLFETLPGHLETGEGLAGAAGGWSWDWQWWGKIPPGAADLSSRILRYRVRKPRGLAILKNLIADRSAPAEHEVA